MIRSGLNEDTTMKRRGKRKKAPKARRARYRRNSAILLFHLD
jgi:hypothetical protein